MLYSGNRKGLRQSKTAKTNCNKLRRKIKNQLLKAPWIGCQKQASYSTLHVFKNPFPVNWQEAYIIEKISGMFIIACFYFANCQLNIQS